MKNLQGEFCGFDVIDGELSIYVDRFKTQTFLDLANTEKLVQRLKEIPLGERIGILRTSDAQKPILIRKLGNRVVSWKTQTLAQLFKA